ncbi:SAF domain-containing protein [Luteipulveratus mongoliensis]|uniref:SAF domain-containing protein n=1 Tax=Luteipulveratus mongoliensis TaxID=571913 RepID=UPI0014702D42|nr:SAF domain-containing protein [Luteipulveratus mongoliensis]
MNDKATGPVARPRWERLLPDTWQGDSRESAWRRARGRRAASGLLVAVASVGVIGAVRPADEPTKAVVVAAHAIPAGQRLVAADLETTRWPLRASLPAGPPLARLVGQTVVTPLSPGEPVTSTRLRSAHTLPPVAADQVVVSVPISDQSLISTVRVGDRVDAWAAASGRQVGRDLRVVGTVAAVQADGGRLSAAQAAQPPGVLLAVDRSVAGALAMAQAGSQSPGTAVLLALRPTT